MFESLRFSGVETFIASGNVVFESRSGDHQALTKKIERTLQKSLGYEVATFIRPAFLTFVPPLLVRGEGVRG